MPGTSAGLRSRGLHRSETGGLLVGIGLGGFIDGIVLHQILQWHNMLSNRVPPVDMPAMAVNMRADGWFHAAAWIATAAGIWLLHGAALRRQPLPTRRGLVGLFLLGWALFNLVEGILDHHVLQLHYVRQVPGHLVYDLSFLALFGVALGLLGWWLWRRDGTTDTAERHA